MKKQSLVYRNIPFYRAVMNLLYQGKYKQRFHYITKFIEGQRVVELCFGDIYIADFCKSKNINWIGYDVNERFLSYAKKLGFDARFADLKKLTALPEADTCIMAGSLYHFHEDLESIIQKMFDASDKIIISEPVLNLSSSKGIIGFIAKRSATVGDKKENFRFDKSSFLSMLTTMSSKFNFQFEIVKEFNKDIIVVLTKTGKNYKAKM